MLTYAETPLPALFIVEQSRSALKASWGNATITDQITAVTIQTCTATPHLHSLLLTCNVALFSMDEINVLGNPPAGL